MDHIDGLTSKIPDGSIYFFMFDQGLKQVPLDDLMKALKFMNKEVRQKDLDNYWRGWYRHDLYYGKNRRSILDTTSIPSSTSTGIFEKEYSDYPIHPYLDQPEIQARFVPCNFDGKPLIKWSQGCMTEDCAEATDGCCYLAENLKGTKMIVIDCDGDHGDEIDEDVIAFLSQFIPVTHAMVRPDERPISFHLTFAVDRVIPTKHFPKAHIDIIGNSMNSIRYFKNKKWNGLTPTMMNDEVWNLLMNYIARKEKKI